MYTKHLHDYLRQGSTNGGQKLKILGRICVWFRISHHRNNV